MQWLNRAMLKLRIENISDREDTDMSTWKEYTVADVISKVIDYRGKTPKKLGGDWSDSGYRALSAKNIKTGKIEFSPMFLSQCTPANGTNEGGCKKMYENSSDYANSFMVLLDRPDAIKIEFKKGKFMMRSNHAAMHPCIIHERYRKERDDA